MTETFPTTARFTRANLHNEGGGYLTYSDENNKRHFVARFKYSGVVSRARFVTELIKSHTPSSYYSEFADGRGKAPLEILKDRNPEWYRELKEKFTCRK